MYNKLTPRHQYYQYITDLSVLVFLMNALSRDSLWSIDDVSGNQSKPVKRSDKLVKELKDV